MPIWVGSPEEIIEGETADKLIRQKNDAAYYNQSVGTIKVDYRRWKQAQQFESRGWLNCWCDATSDRNMEHFKLFEGYKDVPQHLGDVIEIGCGPFTQLQTIIAGRTANSVTLLDPLILHYPNLAACPYRNGKFQNLPTRLMSCMAEELVDENKYDTLIMINVIEHVMDAVRVLNNIKRALKDGGVLVMGEIAYDSYDPMRLFDIGHPIRIKSPIFEGFHAQFTELFKHGNYFIGKK